MNVSTLFFCMAIQDIGKTTSGMNPVIPPTYLTETFLKKDPWQKGTYTTYGMLV
jgi:hypothetical protein